MAVFFLFFFFVTQYNSSLESFAPNFRILSQVIDRKKSSWERKKNEQIKGIICNMWLFFCNTIQIITIKLCTKFQNPRSSSCLEIFGRKIFHWRERKIENEQIKGLLSNMWMLFCYTIQLITIILCSKF